MLSGFQIIEMDPILPSPHSIDGESQVTIIGTDRQIANAAKIKAFGHSIDIQKNTDVAGIFGRGSTINRVLLAVLGTTKINVPPFGIRHRGIRLFDPCLGFLGQFRLESPSGSQPALHVVVFRVQIIKDFLIFPFTEPVVFVDTGVPVGRQGLGHFFRDGRFSRLCSQGLGPNQGNEEDKHARGHWRTFHVWIP